MDFFSQVYQALNAKTSQEKCDLTQEIYHNFESLLFSFDTPIQSLKSPTFANFCEIVEPNKVPQGKFIKSDLNLAHLLHSIAHIEFSAIDLALDCAYRFRNLPKQYYKDWINVAYEETTHFMHLENHLKQIGYFYGAFRVHRILFDSMQKCDVLLDRIALVPKSMEAVGLDVNPFLCAKIKECNHSLKNELLNTLEIILNDEIKHVNKGNVWFDFACEKSGITKENRAKFYIELLKKYDFSFPKANKNFNEEARLKAGFTREELRLLKDEAFLSHNPK